jgi:nucleotide-binding universal stress UspA family protein
MENTEAARAQLEALRADTGSEAQQAALARYLRSQATTAGPFSATKVPHQRRLVVAGFDDSAGGYIAVAQAVVEAGLRGWPLKIVHVQPETRPEQRFETLRTHGADLLADGVSRAHAQDAEVAVVTALATGSVAGELIKQSREAGLLVVGSRGRSGLAGLLAGSVAGQTAAQARCPVLIVRVPAKPAAQWVRRPIVVGVDGSPASYVAVEWATAEAALRNTELLAVYAAERHDRSDDPLRRGPLAAGRHPGVHIRRRWLDGDPRRALIDISANAAAVVVGARGRGNVRGLLTGSVTQALIGHAHSPVFVVRPDTV